MVETFSPRNLEKALEYIKANDAYLLAGGTDLMVKKKSWAGTVPYFNKPVVLLKYIEELRGIEIKGDNLIIGALTTFSEIMDSKLVMDFIKSPAKEIASPGIRNIATIGGNICNASPAADILPTLYALGAEVVLQSIDGTRKVFIEDFILSPGKTIINTGEILREVIIPLRKPSDSYYKKVGTRKANAISKLSFCGIIEFGEDIVTYFSCAFGAVGPRVVCSRELESKVMFKNISDFKKEIPMIIEEYGNIITPIDDQRSKANYRKEVSLRMLEEFLIRNCR